jgi:hypothetical protein
LSIDPVKFYVTVDWMIMLRVQDRRPSDDPGDDRGGIRYSGSIE